MSEVPSDLRQSLSAARAGSREALGEALEACRAYLLMIANRQLDPDLKAKGGASDLVQETFLDAQRDFTQFQGDSADELRAWLRQMLLHNLASFARRYRATDKRCLAREVPLDTGDSARPGPEPVADTPSPSGATMADEEQQALQRALEKLPEDYRQVIRLRNQEGRSFAEAAELMQRSENAVRKLWVRAVERLQHELEAPP
jgi:RNA polymerase sigma-70 factor (ECF subfamily)